MAWVCDLHCAVSPVRRPEGRIMAELTDRRRFLAGAFLAAVAGCRRAGGLPLVGLSQTDTAGAWRIAETASFREAARASGRFELVVADAQDQIAKQLSDVEDLLARR